MPSPKNPTIVVQPGSGRLSADTVPASALIIPSSGSDTELQAHITKLVGAHAASAISTGALAAWADSTTNPASDAQDQLAKIITDLTSTSSVRGLGKITAPARSVWADSTANPAANADAALAKVITDLTTTGDTYYGLGKISCPARSAWADSTTNPADHAANALAKIISDLTSTSGQRGVGKLTAPQVNPTVQILLTASRLDQQLGTLRDWIDALTWQSIMNWSVSTHTTNYQIKCMAYGNGYWFGGENSAAGYLLCSRDAYTWTIAEATGDGPAWNAYFDGTCCIVLQEDKIYYSIDPSSGTWSHANTPIEPHGIVLSSGTYVLVGANKIYTAASLTGPWITPTYTASGYPTFYDIANGNGVVVVVGENNISTEGRIYKATNPIDPSSWELVTIPPAVGPLYAVTWNGYHFCAVGKAGTVLIGDATGTTWTDYTPSFSSKVSNFWDVTSRSNGLTIIVGDSIEASWTANGMWANRFDLNLANWVRCTVPISPDVGVPCIAVDPYGNWAAGLNDNTSTLTGLKGRLPT